MNILKPLAALVMMAGPAVAQDHSGHTMQGAMPGHMAAMDKMMSSMEGMKTTGNADADFLIMMIPHHQSAIDMAEVELEHGSDAETRKMAEQIIDAQKGEIAEMREMLQRMGVEAPE
ncbi:MAG TPA: DUF305 domain-containing protein [Paracoccus sp. (in: a-proteobacteria)]|uniref:DUF305 domain-containing protein n=1 Tax=Paracoccus sp. TaxID=267 RepID=UPI002CED0C48|nr:DUF305 domain-containing protein [Paracoccus sp. (in: a-proteobacteria)]HWL55440.1 DUF305 domain-containing protein [Paracoccus sp. (in: a-proteobacteria)]